MLPGARTGKRRMKIDSTVDGKVTFFKVGKVEKYQNWRLHSSVTQTV
jgi:hypothetical protein